MRRDKSDAAAWASSCETLASSLLALSLLLCCLTSVFVFVTTWAKADEEEVALKLAFVSPALFFHFFSLLPPFHLLHFPQRALLPPITLPHSHFQSSSLLSFTFALFAFFFCGWGRGSCCCCCCFCCCFCFCSCICRCCICCCCCLILFNWVWICEKERVAEYEWVRERFASHLMRRYITYLSQLLIMCFDDTLLLGKELLSLRFQFVWIR